MASLTKAARLLYVPTGATQLGEFVQELIDVEDQCERLLAAHELYKVSLNAASQMQERKPRGDKYWHLLERELEVRTEAHYRIQRGSSLLKTVYLHLEALQEDALALNRSLATFLAERGRVFEGHAHKHKITTSVVAAAGHAACLLRDCEAVIEQVGSHIWAKDGRMRGGLVMGETSGSLFAFHDIEFINFKFESGWTARVVENGHFHVGTPGVNTHVYVNGPVFWEDEVQPHSKSEWGQTTLSHLTGSAPAAGTMNREEASNCLLLWMACACEAEVLRLGYTSPDLRRGRRDNVAALYSVCRILLAGLKPEIYNPETGAVVTFDEIVEQRLAA